MGDSVNALWQCWAEAPWTWARERWSTTVESSWILALNGQGFFGIQTAQGVRYTRDGSFVEVAGRATMQTQQGEAVLDAQMQPITLAERSR